MKSVRSRKWVGRESKTAICWHWLQGQFDAFVTVDRNLPLQQNLAEFQISVVILQAPSARLRDLRRLVPKLQAVLSEASKGQVLLLNL